MSVEPSYSTPDTLDHSRHSSNWSDKGDSWNANGMSTPPPPPPKDGVPDTLTPPSSAFDSPSLRVTQYEEDENDDFQRYLAESYRQQDDEHSHADDHENNNNHRRLHRAASIYSLSRTSFAAQLSRLTSLSMPLGTDLKTEIAALPSAKAAMDKLDSAYTQMQRWMQTAKTVLQGMDASDDVEWAAEGKKSLTEVEAGMTRFEGLVKVYVDSIESIQYRDDIASVSSEALTSVIEQMDVTVKQWKDIQELLVGVKDQVETAMEWTELWNSIMQDIQAELDTCINSVFECEEKRYRVETQENVDIDKLASVVDGQPKKANKVSAEREDMSSALLGLFARMQPLRASLDFLPMRIASFEMRAQEVFPTACEDLQMRRERLEKKWAGLEKDADVLKKELGEDKWVAIFRNAGKQANSMMESVQRTLQKVKARTEDSTNIVTDSSLLKLVESYETKRMHYGTAIARVLTIVGKGMQDRLTVNGEIIRLQHDLQANWKTIEQDMAELDNRLASIDLTPPHDTLQPSGPGSGLPDDLSSISSVTSSKAGQKAKRQSTITATPPSAGSRLPRLRSTSGSYSLKSNANSLSSPVSPKVTPRRLTTLSSLTTPKSNTMLTPTTSRGSSPSLTSRRLSYQTPPTRPSLNRKPSGSSEGRPRWNGSTNTAGSGFGHNYAPISRASLSPYSKGIGATPSKLPRSTESSPLTARTPGSEKRYPPVSMKSKTSRESFSGASTGRLSRNESSYGRAYAHVKSSGYGRPSSALAKSHPTKIPTPGGGAGAGERPASGSATPEPEPSTARPAASKRFSMPPIGKKPGSVDLRPGRK